MLASRETGSTALAALYSEIDPYAAAWLRNLIAGGHIAPGDVHEGDIRDLRPSDVRGFTQFHAFAGIGVWSLALRDAGWPDDLPVWTGSCPCQPFSAAGRGGGTADERHLWPHWFHLIGECAPDEVLLEQVASKDGLGWLDLVHADLEGAGYALWVEDRCAAGVGSPNIRQRLFGAATRGLADPARIGGGPGLRDPRSARLGWAVAGYGYGGGGGLDGDAQRVDDDDDEGLEGLGLGPSASGGRLAALRPVAAAGEPRGLAGADDLERGGKPVAAGGHDGRGAPPGWVEGHGEPGARGGVCGVADADGGDASAEGLQRSGEHRFVPSDGGSGDGCRRPGPTNGFWGAADWLHCRDAKWRPVEPGTFPLAHGAPARVGRLRAYGNAINRWVAATFIASFLEAEADGFADPGDGGLIGHNGGPPLDVADLL